MCVWVSLDTFVKGGAKLRRVLLRPLSRISHIEGEFFSCALGFTRTECPYSEIPAPIAGRTPWVKRCGSVLMAV